MNNRNKNYNYRYNRKKKFYYYCHNNKPFFYHKKYKGKNENSNILLQNNGKDNVILESENNEIKEEMREQAEFVPQKKQEEIVLPKLPIIKVALGIIVIVAIIFGVSYAYFNYYYEDSRQADITTGEVYVKIPEETANITLTKMYPRTDEEARAMNNNYVDFTINSKNTSPTKILAYELNINDGTAVANKARISRDYIKVDLQEKINNEYTYVLEGVSLSNFAFSSAVPINTTIDVPREFRIRLWVSEDVLISDTEDGRTFTQAEFANLYATYHIEVSAVDKKVLCTRVTDATKLHTETCSQTSNYCAGDGYTGDNTLITYGNAKALNTQLTVGDAFDCDVNGDGIINKDGNGNSTERFYYVSEYYNTDTKQFDNSTGYATLIYYSNTYNNGTSVVVSDSGAAYDSSNENWHGPVTAVTHLPTTSTWSNITLKTTSRTILACNDGSCSNTPVETTNSGSNTITNPFSYAGKAARLLTLQEIKHAGCDILSSQTSLTSTGALKACNFLFEGTLYANSSKGTYGPWLETPRASNSNSAWFAYAYYRRVSNDYAGYVSFGGVRPTIDVPYSLMDY